MKLEGSANSLYVRSSDSVSSASFQWRHMTCGKHFPHYPFTAVVTLHVQEVDLFSIVLISHKHTFLCVCVHTLSVPQCASGGQWTTFRSQSLPSTCEGGAFIPAVSLPLRLPSHWRDAAITHLAFVIWVPGIKLESSGLHSKYFTHWAISPTNKFTTNTFLHTCKKLVVQGVGAHTCNKVTQEAVWVSLRASWAIEEDLVS